ncbi:Retrovirus-related Pol polyprotein from transposon TNT 1-94-like protein [Drosera capensis]
MRFMMKHKNHLRFNLGGLLGKNNLLQGKKGKKDYVCKLKRSLYGLKQAPRQWYKKFKSVICGQGYRKTISDHCVFVNKFSDGNFIILLLYVDDMLIVGKDISRIDTLKKQLGESFAMKDMGPAKQILGIRIMHDRKEKKLWLSQKHYVERVLQRFRIGNPKAVFKPYTSFWTEQSVESMRVERLGEPIADMDVNIYRNPEHAEIENDLNEENNEEGFDYNI